MLCPVCGYDNPPTAKFCAQCAAPLNEGQVCIHCGTSNPPGSKFCTECARPLTQGPGDRGPEQVTGDKGQGTAAAALPLPPGEAGQVAEGDAGRVRVGPTSFANGRYQVQKFVGQGGKKRVYLAHDTRLDRDVAFALISAEGLDTEGRARIRREAQAMARLGDHPHVVTVYDIGEEAGQPYLVSQYMAGGDLEEAIRAADDHRLPLEQVLAVTDQVCQALEHAHKQGIVHRDVKPGNVWLAEGTGDRAQVTGEVAGDRGQWTVAGTGSGPGALSPNPFPLSPIVAKLGDFGLALAPDRSRMTQAGMVVGTAHYMAPEQALGSDVTPRSDLYALGAMLYELVTGRPPFVGDEPVAIITQHLHTAPVLPSWHRQGLPAALETLILRLLEKDPSNRPASATEVRAALASIAAPTATPPPNLGEGQGERADVAPLYRRLFIGREPELRRLETAFDGALSGAGSLMMVVGEPGIGKTAVCEQLATYVALRGGRALVGHCYEEGSLSLPYLPFAEALRTHVLERPPEALKEELGTGAAEVARIVSEIRDRVQVELRPPGDPEDDRYRLFQAVSGFLQHASRVQPIVLVLEDLHWADRGTLDLLVHIARQLKGTRLLIVGTYRDVEVDRAHPLSAALAELRRVQELERVPLRGLTPDEVHRLISGLTGQEVRWSLAEAVHRQTEGNPLFVQEVFRYLAEEGVIRREDGRWRRAGEEPPEMSIPEGLRDVIGKRLSRLSVECNALLSVAAVIGREFALDTLRAVAGIAEEALLSALEEALRVGVLEERARPGQVQYRFGHALFRQTLYEELIAPRRIRLHQHVARAMEQQYAARVEEHAAELAEHYAHSSDAADLAKAVEYGQMAARRASAVYAHGEAVRHLDQAIKVQEVLAPDDRAQPCDLLLALAEALMPTGELARVLDPVAPEALALAEELGDQERAARACRIAIEALERSAPFAAWRSPEGQRWADLADRYAAPGTATRVFTDIALADVRDRENRPDEANALRSRALDLARQLDDQGARLFAVAKANQGGNLSWQDQLALVEEAESWPRDRASARDVGLFLYRSGLVHLYWGERGRAEELWAEMEALASRTRDGNVLLRPFFVAAILALLDGRLEGAVEIGEQIVAKGEEFGGAQRALGFAHNLTLQPRFHLGQPEDWGPNWGALLLAHLGRRAEAQELLRESVASGSAAGQGSLSSPALLEAAVLLEDADAARTLSEEAAPLAPMLTPSGTGQNLACVARHLGAAAALLGDRAAARRYYEQGLQLCEKVRFRPEIALIHLGLAELALSDQPSAISREETKLTADELKAEGLQHLEFALAEFQAMKMRPSFERALRLQGQLAT